MVRLLDRSRRLSDGKEFAVLATGGETLEALDRAILESEDGERLESSGSRLGGKDAFELIPD